MRANLRLGWTVLGLSLLGPALLPLGCITVVEQSAGDGTTVAGANDNSGGAPANDNAAGGSSGISNDNSTVNDNGGSSGTGNGCEDEDDLRVTYVNEAAVRVVFVENFRDSSDESVSARILSLQPAGSSGSSRVECAPCPATAGVRNIAYFDASPSSDGETPTPMSASRFNCNGGITFTFHADKTVTITVDD